MPLADQHDMVKAFPSNRANHALCIGVLTRRAWRNHRLSDTQGPGLTRKPVAINLVPVANQIPVPRQNFVQRQAIDPAGLTRRQSRRDGQPPAPPASTGSSSLRRSPSYRPRELSPPPPARRLQEDRDPAEGPKEGPALLGRAVESVARLAAGSYHRVARHRPALAAASLPRLLV